MRPQARWRRSRSDLIVSGGGIPTDGLVRHYTGDNVSGTTLIDETGGGNATLVNGPTVVAGYNGNAIQYDGTNDYATLPANISFSGGITIAMRVKFNDLSTGALASKRDGGSNNDFQFYVPPGTTRLDWLTWGVSGGITLSTPGSVVATGVWYFLAARYDLSQKVVTVDSTDYTQTGISGAIANTASNIRIADDWFSNYHAIIVDDWLLYDRAVSDAELDTIRGLI